MDILTRLYVRLTANRGQTMGEYALVMAGVAIVAFAAYQFLGTQISTAVNGIAGQV